MKQILLLNLILCFLSYGYLTAQSERNVTGEVTDAIDGTPLPGVVVKVKNETRATVTDADGRFSLEIEDGHESLEFSYIGYAKQQIRIPSDLSDMLEIALYREDMDLGEVEVYSTGFQELSKERATGSFVALDRELINRRVSTGILDRLEDVTSGLIFNRAGALSDPISIRGRSTIFANTQPLIVIDNFPYDGPLENINPNDVESITVLRDAAAASIWGARAGNGVIVITTKSGSKASGMRVSINMNTNIIEAPDMFYRPQMSPGQMVEAEGVLFQLGRFNSAETSPNRTALSYGAEAWIAHRNGLISEAEKNSILSELSAHDIRNDLSEYFHRNQINRQFSFDINGATDNINYLFSAGYDHNTEDVTGNSNSRLTLNSKNTWTMLKGKMRLSTGMYYNQTIRNTGTELPNRIDYSIYDRLVSPTGEALPITRTYSTRFLESVENNFPGLPDWRYRPHDEIGMLDHRNDFSDLRLNAGLYYGLAEGLQVEVLHQFWKGTGSLENYSPQSAFFTRDLINRFAQLGTDGELTYPVPLGSILDWGISEAQSHNFRSQLRYQKEVKDHELNLLAGFESKDLRRDGRNGRYYGYNRDNGTTQFVDNATEFRLFHNPNMVQRIPTGESISGTVERYISYYANAAYHFRKKYGLTVSARRDASNLFGVETNQRAVPLWSAGGSWIISEEQFLRSSWIDYLKLRTTYGFNGNVDRTLSSYITASYMGSSANRMTGLPFARITNPPNPSLRWEKIGIFNLGLDFSLARDRFSGSLEFYRKTGEDLIGTTPMPTSTGLVSFRGNFADTRTLGADLILRADIVRNQEFGWSSNLLASHVYEKVTGYQTEPVPSQVLSFGGGTGLPAPVEGRPLIAIYSYRSAGLDPDTGAPRGYLDGEPSTNYASILGSTTLEDMIYHGPSRPEHFGAWRNDFSYRSFSLSVNISYRLGYYFRRESVDYNTVLAGRISHSDYGLRWQNPGDEASTVIPAFPTVANFNRDRFFQFSEDLVERADNIRLQDIRLGYRFGPKSHQSRLPNGIEFYTYFNNLAILWKATDQPIDPDFPMMRPLRSVAVGLRIDL
jgi:TonB-linked SusC/RagA family outer membrane protein